MLFATNKLNNSLNLPRSSVDLSRSVSVKFSESYFGFIWRKLKDSLYKMWFISKRCLWVSSTGS